MVISPRGASTLCATEPRSSRGLKLRWKEQRCLALRIRFGRRPRLQTMRLGVVVCGSLLVVRFFGRSLILNSDTTGIDLEKMQIGLHEVTNHLQIADKDLQAAKRRLSDQAQVAQADVRTLAERLAATDSQLTNTVR